MKKLLSLVIIVIMLLSFMSVSASGFTAEVESVQAKCGDTVTINITLNDNPGIITAVFSLTYDKSRLELVSAADKNLLDMNVFSQTYTTYPFVLSWYSASNTNFNDDGVLAELRFKVLEDAAPGEAFINLEFDEDDIFNSELENVELTVKNGSVYVEDNITGDSNEQNTESGNSGNNNTSSPGGSRGSSSTSTGGNTVSGNTATVQNSSANNDAKNTIVFTIDKKEAVVFGETKINDVAPIIRYERTMLPARFVAENLGAEVLWDDVNKAVTVKKADKELLIYIGSDEAYVDGEKVVLDSAAFIENDRTYTPLRFIAENLGADVIWNKNTREVTIIRK